MATSRPPPRQAPWMAATTGLLDFSTSKRRSWQPFERVVASSAVLHRSSIWERISALKEDCLEIVCNSQANPNTNSSLLNGTAFDFVMWIKYSLFGFPQIGQRDNNIELISTQHLKLRKELKTKHDNKVFKVTQREFYSFSLSGTKNSQVPQTWKIGFWKRKFRVPTQKLEPGLALFAPGSG